MASQLTYQPDNREDLLYVKRVKKGKTIHCGYRRDYLARNLSEMEERFVVCKICSGIMREASLSKGETTCLVCSESPQDLNPVKMVDNAVNEMEIKCPLLRDCTWNGPLSAAENHLENCNYFLLQCTDCKLPFARSECDNHKSILCILRVVFCDYCGKDGKAKNLEEHFEFCDNYPISCPHNCGEEFPRMELSEHRSNCELEEISCPYGEYGCKTKSLLRRDLLAHKKEYIVEHTDMSLARIKELECENMTLKRKFTGMKLEGRIMKQLDGVEWEIMNVGELTTYQDIGGPTFYVNNYRLRIYLIYNYNRFFEPFLRFYLKRSRGKFDRNLEVAYITQYRIIIVNKQDIAKSNLKDGPMEYELIIGRNSQYFGNISPFDYTNCFTADNSLLLRFYFEVKCQKPLTNLMTCNEEILRLRPKRIPSDPFNKQMKTKGKRTKKH